LKKETEKDFNSAVDKFDKSFQKGASQASDKVSEEAAKAKTSSGSWFGFGGK